MDLLGDLSPVNLYISLVARDEAIKTLVRKPKMVFFKARIPYAEILAVEDTKAIIIDTLLNELYRLERYKELLDVAVLKQEIQARFEIEMTV
ncbi:MAG: hypothetical protein IPO07_12785 [Haliscomenobacter sp.]|nr:hypothetical protein [Haliscomenobacter sp.]MBK9489557.1 hypothetical protein [Haliscomenobacter sp.]